MRHRIVPLFALVLAAAAAQAGPNAGGVLSRMIRFGERHLRWMVSEYAVSDYAEHYHLERNHQGLGNESIELPGEVGLSRVACRDRHGGMLRCPYGMAA